MRATLSGYYRNLQFDQTKTARELFDVTKQISSGQKIQYAYEDTSLFVDAVRLDNEVTTLTQIKQNALKARQVSTNTDTTMNDMTKIIEAMKVKLVSAANESHSPESLNAIASELRGLEKNLIQLANTSIDGDYLFSGSLVNTKPIGPDGTYQGNAEDIKAFLGSGVEQTYNIHGQDLFLGDENDTRRKISLNVPQLNQTQLYPDVMIDPGIPRTLAKEEYISEASTIRDLMGDTDNVIDVGTQKHFFYIRATNSDGEAIKAKLTMSDDQTVDDLMNSISALFQPAGSAPTVSVTLNEDGQIEIEDKRKGSSQLDFHMVAATDFGSVFPASNANVNDIDNLDGAETDFQVIADEIAAGGPITNPLFVRTFMQSGMTPSGAATNIEALKYDRVEFLKEGPTISGNVSQITVDGNAYAQDGTTLSQVYSAFDTSVIPAVPVNSLDGQQFDVTGTDINGVVFTAVIRLGTDAAGTAGAGSSFSLDGGATYFDIYNVDSPRTSTAGDEVTYRQFMDVLNMALSGTAPAGANTAAEYDAAILTADTLSSVKLDQAGRLKFQENGVGLTQASLSISDTNSSDFTGVTGLKDPLASSMVFNANNALEISDPKTNFFEQIDNAIRSVELGRIRADGTLTESRNGGVQNSIQALDDLSNHLFNQHSVAGVQSQTLQATEERTDLMIITTKTLRSETLDVDIAEASLELKQLELNYQAMLSTVSRITQLSLVNYL